MDRDRSAKEEEEDKVEYEDNAANGIQLSKSMRCLR
jgi:hypothetical protein